MIILAGDIGGTNTRLGLFSSEEGPGKPIATKTVPSRTFSQFETIVSTFIREQDCLPEQASFGVAGPIKCNRATLMNLPWVVDGDALSSTTGIPAVSLINDLEAMAYAIPHLDSHMVEPLNEAAPVENGVKALIAPGTGLGEVFLTHNGTTYQPHSSEGGHCEFGPQNDVERDLLTYLHKQHRHVSYERVCSGMGLPNLYTFLRDTKRYPEPAPLAEKLANAEDHTPIIVEAGLNEPEEHPICVAVLTLFANILAAKAGNLAMTVSSFGGLYIGGGIPPRIIDYIRKPEFLETFMAKGRLKSMVQDIPIYLVKKADIALMGAACHAFGN